MNVNVDKIFILVRDGFMDYVTLETDFPSPVPAVSKQSNVFMFQAEHGTGKTYCEQHFPGIPIEVTELDRNGLKTKP